MDQSLEEANQKIQSSLEHLKMELSSIRAGRANPQLVENVTVSAYGGKMKLLEVGTISAPQPSLLTVQVWDASIVSDVIKSIQEANLGINPSSEGNMIRLPIPSLTEERREEYIKLVHIKVEEVKVAIRQIRQEIREQWEKAKEVSEIGEDEFDRRGKILQEFIDRASTQIDLIGKAKEEELLQL